MLDSDDHKTFHVTLTWLTPQANITADFDPATKGFGNRCMQAGTATNGEVIYVSCTFDC